MPDKKSLLFSVVFIASVIIFFSCGREEPSNKVQVPEEPLWHGWNKFQIKPEDSLIRLGHDIIENTSYYLGPKGTIAQTSNAMNCQNCHLEAGTLPWANNFGGVVSTYPRYKDRSASMETLTKKVNDCFERSMNGKALDTNSHAMKAILAYLNWIGSDVPKGKKPKGSGIMDLPFLNRAADTLKGRQVFTTICQRCHGADGQGQKNPEGYGYTYPPLWGPDSYNTGASSYRISRIAGYVKNNMPKGEVTYENPKLTDEEAWDVAAYISSHTRPAMDVSKDWPDISKKPIDYPFGPYSDTFSEKQHKYGPFKPIKAALKGK